MYRQQLFPGQDLIAVLVMLEDINSNELGNVSWVCVTVNQRILSFSALALLPASLTNASLLEARTMSRFILWHKRTSLLVPCLLLQPHFLPTCPPLPSTHQPFLPLQETSTFHPDSLPSCPPLTFLFHVPHLPLGSHQFGTFPGQPTNFQDYRFPSLNYF